MTSSGRPPDPLRAAPDRRMAVSMKHQPIGEQRCAQISFAGESGGTTLASRRSLAGGPPEAATVAAPECRPAALFPGQPAPR